MTGKSALGWASLSVAMTAASAPSVAEAYSVVWCATVPVFYADSQLPNPDDLEEDFWLDTWNPDDTQKAARGAQYMLLNSSTGVPVSGGYLKDGLNGTAGCTGTLSMPGGAYTFIVWSNARVADNTISVGDTDGVVQAVAATWIPVTASGTKPIGFSPTGAVRDVFNVEQAAAWALFSQTAGLVGQNLAVRVGDPVPCTQGPSCLSGGIIHLGTYAINQKFRVAHEMGHWFQSVFGVSNAASYSYDGAGATIEPACGPGGQGSGWGPVTLEWVGAAVHEGFAEFYSAAVWNDDNFTSCWIVEGFGVGGGASCEGASSGRPMAWVAGETCRSPDDPDSGAAIDWLRIFWAVHTSGPAPDPGLSEMLNDWLDGAGPWSKDTAFAALFARALTLGGDLCDNFLWATLANAPYYGEP